MTTVAQGTLSVGSINNSPGGSSNLGLATSAVVLGAATTSGLLSYTGNSDTFTRGLIIGAGGGEWDSTTAGQTLTVLGAGVDVTSGGTFTVGGAGNTAIAVVINGSGALVQNGTGTLTLSSANTYTGATIVNSGTLLVGNGTTGSINNTSAINVSGGSLLFNQGATFNTATHVTTNGTALTPGVIGYSNTATAGNTVTLGALSLVASSVTAIDFGSSNINTIIFNQGTAEIGLAGSTVLNVYNYIAGDVLAFSGSTTPNAADNFSQVQFFSGAIGSSTSIGFGQEVAFGGGYQIVVAATPEPSTIIVGVCFLGLLLTFQMNFRKAILTIGVRC